MPGGQEEPEMRELGEWKEVWSVGLSLGQYEVKSHITLVLVDML